MYRICLSAFLAIGLVLGGCATIVGDNTQLVTLSSTPDAATVLVTDEKGATVFKGTTPTTVTLPKSDGSYWGGKDYTVTFKKEGFADQLVEIKSSANGWYIGGNIIFGGLIGWFLVDPFSGSMYNLSPKEVSAFLGEQGLLSTPSNGENLTLLFLDETPDGLKESLTRLN